jgi:DNA-binding response OmpR family regulator
VLIVLADKDPYDLQALYAGLVEPEREVLIVPDGENIVTITQARAPDVIVMGASLGQMGAFGVCKDIKLHAKTGALREPKIIVLLEREADAWIAKQSLVDAWLVKPIDLDVLDQLIVELTGQPEPV